MGTSNSYGGPGGSTPLVPTWLGGGDENSTGGDGGQQSDSDQGDTQQDADGQNQDDNSTNPTITQAAPGSRFQTARGNFSRFARSGGSDRRSLGRAVSGYVSGSMGGSKNASKRMGSSRRVAGGLISFLGSAATTGLQSALNERNLGHLIGKSAEEIFLGLGDIICPQGGSVDEGIARNAFIETIVELANLGITDLNTLTAEQVFAVIEMFAANSIEARLCNDIGTKICIAPENVPIVENVQRQLHDFIARAVSDALEPYSNDVDALTSDQTTTIVDNIYTEAFSILETLGEAESE
jgi:hypothetical protein